MKHSQHWIAEMDHNELHGMLQDFVLEEDIKPLWNDFVEDCYQEHQAKYVN